MKKNFLMFLHLFASVVICSYIFAGNFKAFASYDYAPAGIELASNETDSGLDYISIDSGKNVYASIVVYPGEAQLCDFNATLTYDSSKLSLTSITDYSEYMSNIVKNSATGTITYSASHAGGCAVITGSTKLFTAVFKVIGDGGEYAQIAIKQMDLDGGSPNPLIKNGMAEIKYPVVDPPEIPPSDDNGGNTSPGGSTIIPGTSVPTPQSGAAHTADSILPETGVNISDSLKSPILKSAYFASDQGDRSKSCRGLILSGSAEPNSKVHLIVDQAKLEYTADASASGEWSINISDYLDIGKYGVTMYSAVRDLVSNSSTDQFIFAMPCKEHVAVGGTLTYSFKEKISNIFHSKVFSIVMYFVIVLLILGITFLLSKRNNIFKNFKR